MADQKAGRNADQNFSAASSRRHLRNFLLIFGLPILLLAITPPVLNNYFPQTAQKLRAWEAEQAAREVQRAADVAEQEAAQKATSEQDRYLCHLESVCENYSTVRQDCATAGNFDNCVKVKMGDDDVPLIDSCTNDGKLAYPPEKMPSSLLCFIFRIGG
jgi:hypothetical protein